MSYEYFLRDLISEGILSILSAENNFRYILNKKTGKNELKFDVRYAEFGHPFTKNCTL